MDHSALGRGDQNLFTIVLVVCWMSGMELAILVFILGLSLFVLLSGILVLMWKMLAVLKG